MGWVKWGTPQPQRPKHHELKEVKCFVSDQSKQHINFVLPKESDGKEKKSHSGLGQKSHHQLPVRQAG